MRIVDSDVIADHELRTRIADDMARDRWIHGINLGLALAIDRLIDLGLAGAAVEVRKLGTREITTADVQWARARLAEEPAAEGEHE